MLRLIEICLLAAIVMWFSQVVLADADTIFINGNIYTLNWNEPDQQGKPANNAPFTKQGWRPDAQAIVVADGVIRYVGSNDQAKKFSDRQSKLVDLKGATVLPGLIDSHVHIAELGEILQRANLAEVDSPEAAVAKLKAYAKDLKDGEWLIGQGWDEGAWANNYPDRLLLDAAFPNNPVYLRSLHGFAVWVNTPALAQVGIDKQTQAPVGGEILRDEDGFPTGILLNRATTLVADKLPKASTEKFASYIEAGLRQMAKDGFVAVHQAGAESLHIAALQYLQQQNRLPLRVYAMLSARDVELTDVWQSKGPLIDERGFLDVRSVKAYYDGALGSRGARLLQDYADRPGHRGVSGAAYGFDASVLGKMIAAGFQVGIHAIGDAGNREVLDYLSAVNEKHPESLKLRHRVEHAQVIHADDFKRFKQLALIASMEPPHAVEDKTWAEARLGNQRIKGAYAWRTLRQHQVPLTFNSDLPGSDHSIFYGLHAAVTRRDKQAEPANGWYPKQAVGIEEAIRGYTSWAAYSAFREHQAGVLKRGHWADLTVMDIDPFRMAETNPAALLNGNILMTVVNGNVVYRSD